MAALHALLEQERVRLVTLTGAGGAGKSRLAIELATDVGDRFDRAWFVDLSAVDAPDLVPSAVAQAIGVQEGGRTELAAIVREMLSIGRFLIILDNFERVLEGGTYVARLLAACRDLVIVATSREALRVRPERIFQVEPLATPRRDQLNDLQALRKCASVELFEDRARAAQPSFQLTDDVLPTVAEICLDLDGLPLAIELVAAQASVLTPREILERLSARAPLLTTGPRDLPARHRTLDATVAWSYELLTPSEQAAFRLCSVFAGFTLAAMSAIQPETAQIFDAAGTLSQLVAKSLVRVTHQVDRPSRYSLLDTIRTYASDRLLESGELASAQRAHARYHVGWAEELQASMRGPGMADALDSLEAEYGNLRAVFQWSSGPTGDLELGLRLAGALYRFWIARGHLAEARTWVEAALARPDAVPPSIRAVALNGAGVMAGMQHDHERAVAYLTQSLLLWKELGDVARQAAVALNLGFVAQNTGHLQKAEQQFAQAKELFARNGDRNGQANALGSQANIARDLGDLHRAISLLEQCLALFRDIGDQWGIANTQANLGHVRLAFGDRPGAQQAFRESLQARRELGNVLHIAESLEGLAAVMADDEPRFAVRLLGAAELMREGSGAPVPAVDKDRYQAIVERARSGLTSAVFRASWNAGRALSVNSAIDIAMGSEPRRLEDSVEAPPESRVATPGSSLDVLSTRERDIAVLIAEGYSNRAIADKLVVSVKTVETHVKHMFVKLNVRNRAGVASAVSRAGSTET
jgi:predicted ATPase/DNA-binding CsgD family transcriptional regulator